MYGIRDRDGSHDHLALDNEFIARGNAQRISLSALIFFLFYILYLYVGIPPADALRRLRRSRSRRSTRAPEKLDRNKVLKNNNI